MATKKESPSNVTRIKATSSKASQKPNTTPKAKEVKKDTSVSSGKTPRSASKLLSPFRALGAYFKGAWVELRQVRWPTRKATWSLTGAVLLFTTFFAVLILLLDAGFKYLFEQLLG